MQNGDCFIPSMMLQEAEGRAGDLFKTAIKWLVTLPNEHIAWELGST